MSHATDCSCEESLLETVRALREKSYRMCDISNIHDERIAQWGLRRKYHHC